MNLFSRDLRVILAIAFMTLALCGLELGEEGVVCVHVEICLW